MEWMDVVRNAARDLDAMSEAAHDLWTWLPSYKEAQKYHGDYAINHMPSFATIMAEASIVLAKVEVQYPLPDSENEGYFYCPCGEDHASSTEAP